MRKRISQVCIALIIATLAHCQEPKFSKAYVFSQLALETADAAFTYHNCEKFSQWGYIHEYNPIANPFINHGPKALSFYFAAESVSKIGLVYWLHRRHSRFEKWAKISTLSSSAVGASYSFYEGRQMK